jgi:hypothetical protein
MTESFNVTAYYDKRPIAKKLVANLEPQTEAALIIPWNTSSVPLGSYVISGVADTVPGEIETSGKTCVDGTVTILAPPLPSTIFHFGIFFMFILLSALVSCLGMFLILSHQSRRKKKKRSTRSLTLIAHPHA